MPDHRESDTHGNNQREARPTARKSAPEDEISTLQWIASGLGLLVVIGAFGLILYDVFVPDAPPNLKVHMTRIVPLAGRYLVEVTVSNDGGSTAASVAVQGTLYKGDKTFETASTTYDYVPAYSEAAGGMFFTYDPRAYKFKLEANAYQEP